MPFPSLPSFAVQNPQPNPPSQIPHPNPLTKTTPPYKFGAATRTVSNQPKSTVRSITLCLSCRTAFKRSPRESSRFSDLFSSSLRPHWPRNRPAFQPSRSHVWSSTDVTANTADALHLQHRLPNHILHLGEFSTYFQHHIYGRNCANRQSIASQIPGHSRNTAVHS